MDEKQEDKEVYARIMQLLQAARYAEAERLCDLTLKTAAAASHLPWFYLGAARQFQGKLDKALEAFQKAHAIAPNDIEVINACASCFDQLKRHQEAYDTMLKAYQLAPGDSAVCANLGAALEKL
ncbi:MAG TPA: tetratricopeptide repeat protein, partial [Methylophilaceae bacterium]|nr:tetratricopeptide repeat protein [Methylophilaceae bacterium]